MERAGRGQVGSKGGSGRVKEAGGGQGRVREGPSVVSVCRGKQVCGGHDSVIV